MIVTAAKTLKRVEADRLYWNNEKPIERDHSVLKPLEIKTFMIKEKKLLWLIWFLFMIILIIGLYV